MGCELWKGKPQLSHEAQISHHTNSDSAPQMMIVLAALQCWSCWERAVQPLSANEAARKERPCSGDLLTPRSYLRICNTPSSQGNEFIWYQKHHHNPHWVFQLCCRHSEQQQSLCQRAFGARQEPDPPWCGLILTCNQSKIKLSSRLDRCFLHLCHLLLLCLKTLPPVNTQHCHRLWLNIKQPGLGYCEQGDKSPDHKKSHSCSWLTASGTEIYKNALFKKKINCSPEIRSVQAETRM